MSASKKIQVLIVDDSATIRTVISKYLGEGYATIHSGDGEEAWQHIQSNDNIALVFADMHMPVMNGMMLLQRIRDSDNEHILNLPVIMITGHEDSEAAKQASFNMGATDFISKPFSEVDIISRAKSYTKLNQKITELEQNVTHDLFTGLFNKNGFRELADKAIAGSNRHDLELSILNTQIRNIEEIASQHDKAIVNQIIASIAENLQKSLRKEEAISYNGAGVFSVLLPMTKVFKAHIVAMRFQLAIGKLAFEIGDKRVRVKLAVGLTSTEGEAKEVDFDDLNLQANQALEASLKHPSSRVFRYDELNLKDVTNELDAASSLATDLTLEKHTFQSGDNASEEAAEEIDMSVFSGYMAEIMQGDFENVPDEHLASMIEPLASFLNYAKKQIKFNDADLEIKA